MSQVKALPLGWKWVTMNDVCNKIGDIDHKMPQQLETGYPYVSTKDFTDDLKISFDKAKYISKEDYLNLSRKIKPEKGDIIFPRYGTIGKNILIDFDKEFLVSYSCAVVKPNRSLVLSKYVYLYSLSPKIAGEIKKYVVETTQANIGIASIKSFVFPLPPLSIQAQIVEKLEALLSELDKGKAQLLTAQAQLKTYRQAVLKYAFETIPQSTENTVEECCSHIVDCLHSTAKFQSSGHFCVDTTCIENGKILFNKIRYVSEETFKERISRLKPIEGDIFFAREGTVGTTLIVPRGIDVCLGQRMMMFRLKKNILSKYFMYYFQSPLCINQYKSLISGTTAPHLNIRDVRKLKVVTTSIEEQQKIVTEIESRLSVCDKLEETLKVSLAQCETLRQSLLKRAFEGKLV